MDMAATGGNGMAARMHSAWMWFLFALFSHTRTVGAVFAGRRRADGRDGADRSRPDR